MTQTPAPQKTQPPDPHPRRPRTPCPPGAVDCHIHLFGPEAQWPVHPRSRYVPNDALPETNIALQDTLGLAGAVIVSGGGYGTDYRHLAHTLETYPGRFWGVALLADDVTREEMARLHALGVRAVRFVSRWHAGATPYISPQVAALAADFGWHVQFYPGRGDLAEHVDNLLALPNHALVLDHFATLDAALGADQPAIHTLLRLLDTGRVWVKLSGPMRCSDQEPPYPDVTPIAQRLVAHAPERLIWGSDWPHVNMNNRSIPNDGDLFDLLAEWVPDTPTRDRILRDNPVRLFGLPAMEKSP